MNWKMTSSGPGSMPEKEDELAVARLLNLVREGHAEQESISAEGVALSEWAEDIIRIWAPQGGTMHLAA